MEQRYRVVLQIQAGVPVTEVAEAFQVSRHAWTGRSSNARSNSESFDHENTAKPRAVA